MKPITAPGGQPRVAAPPALPGDTFTGDFQHSPAVAVPAPPPPVGASAITAQNVDPLRKQPGPVPEEGEIEEDEIDPEEVSVPTNWAMPDLLKKKNWGNDQDARLSHVMCESQLRKFAIESQVGASRLELQAQQTPKDKFWSIVHWMYNCAYDVEWFKPFNEFGELHPKVSGIDPATLDQFRTKADLQSRWAKIKLAIQICSDAYETSGQNADVLTPGNDYDDFYHMTGKRQDGGTSARGNSGKWYAFLLSRKHPMLQNLAEAVLNSNVRSSDMAWRAIKCKHTHLKQHDECSTGLYHPLPALLVTHGVLCTSHSHSLHHCLTVVADEEVDVGSKLELYTTESESTD